MIPITLCFLAIVRQCTATVVVELYQYNSSNPTKINNVEDGSKLYIAASDKAVILSGITLSSNGITTTLQQILNNFDDNGYSTGLPVNSDITIATTNTQDVTENLSGILFISNPAMAKDPNFLVYVVSDQVKTIDRSANNETTLVLLNKRVEPDQNYKPFYNSRLDSFVQPATSTFFMYRGVPGDGYSDPTYQETTKRMIFRNPVRMIPSVKTPDTIFINNIEPIQFSLRSFYVRALGSIKFNISQEWNDMTTYQTTSETTTGYTMSQRVSDNATINFKNTPNHDGISGFMITTSDMSSNMTVTSCNGIDCKVEVFSKDMPVYADFFQNYPNDTVMYMDHAKTDFGFYYLQYYRIEGNVSSPTTVTSTTVQTPETTTKSSLQLLNFTFILIVFFEFLLV
ncbi:hypothetical protein L5515_012853 [Caenorhabditis briggsae]|uniref:Uncharacterized protein n=1 Tax=Caenorhabditis briggsae TaxID=6238 RepID=A0AAE9F0J5_CAEBR|nr:hypothetical protein L5515_012853 [Caenorhabditis briggsae]